MKKVLLRGKKRQLRKTSTAFAANPWKIGWHRFTGKAKRRAGMWNYKMAHGLETCCQSSEFQFPSRTGPSLGRAVLQPAWYIGQRWDLPWVPPRGSLPAGPVAVQRHESRPFSLACEEKHSLLPWAELCRVIHHPSSQLMGNDKVWERREVFCDYRWNLPGAGACRDTVTALSVPWE